MMGVRRLRSGQRVTVELEDGDADHFVDCRVVEVFGSVASLARADDLDQQLSDRLSDGFPGYLVFYYRGGEVALRGLAAATRERASVIDFTVLDSVQLRERRQGRRVQLVTRARVLPIDTGSSGEEQRAIETFTLNLSPSGALLRYRAGLADHRAFAIELFFGADPRPVRCRAVYARRTDDGIGVEFRHLEQDAKTRLVEIIAARSEALLSLREIA